jgi:hypothetical protein
VTWVRVGKVLGLVAAILVLFVVAVGNSPLRAPVIALAALVVLVAGGNWLNDWLGIRRRSPTFEEAPPSSTEVGGDEGTEDAR